MTALVESDNWEEIVGRCHAHGGTEFFHWFMHSKQIYEPRETVGIFLSPEITLLPTKPLLPYYPLEIPWVTKIISGFAGFLMAFCWKTKHTPWLSHMSAKVLFSRFRKDTSRAWLSLGPLLLLLLLLFFSFSYFLGLWAFMVLLNFMNWAFFC